jgi:hypothetical protein
MNALAHSGFADAQVFPSGFERAFLRYRKDCDLPVHCDPYPTHS